MSMMQEKMYMDVDDVCAILGVSKTYAYSLMREYNKELKAKGYIVVAGKISTKFLAEKISCNSRARVWILNLEIFWRFITKIWMSVSEKTLCTRSDILLT